MFNCEECKIEVERKMKSRIILCPDCKRSRQNARCREFKAKNRDYISNYNAKYKKENADEISTYNSKYFQDNKDVIQAQSAARHAKYKKEKPQFKFMESMRNRMRRMLKAANTEKYASTLEILGCTKNDFTLWIEFLSDGKFPFEEHGEKWHYDHVIPCAAFDHTDEKDVAVCFHWSNYQPLSCADNLKKNAKITMDMLMTHLARVDEFLKLYSEQLSENIKIIGSDLKKTYIKENV